MTGLPRAWSAAKAAGCMHYFTGRPCKRGHLTKRLASTGQCLECLRVRMAALYAQSPESARQRSRDFRIANPEKVRDRVRRWEAANRDHRAAYERAQYAKPDSRRRVKTTDRESRKRAAVPIWYGEMDELVLSEAAKLAVLRRKATGIKWEIDHAIPLRSKWASGLHCGANLQVIPATLNRQKSNKPMYLEPGSWVASL